MDDESRIETLEAHVAELQRQAEELSDVLALRGREVDELTRKVAMLMEREIARQSEGEGGIHFGDEKPPHW